MKKTFLLKRKQQTKKASVALLFFSLLLLFNFANSQTMDNQNLQTINGATLKKQLEIKLKKDPSEHIYAIVEDYNFKENELKAKVGSDILDVTGKNILIPKDSSLIGKYRFTKIDNEENIIIIWTLLGINDKIIRLAPANIFEDTNKNKKIILVTSRYPIIAQMMSCKNYCLELIKDFPVDIISQHPVTVGKSEA